MSARSEKDGDISENTPGFSLSSGSSLFSSRSNDVFAGLEALEQKHAAFQKHQDSSESLQQAGVMKHDPVDDQEDIEKQGKSHSHSSSRHKEYAPYRQRDSRNRPPKSWNSFQRRDRNAPSDNFCRPRHLPPRSKGIPDYKIHPEKWTSYSLKDISEKDLSEKSNTRAALDFLWERKNERERQERLAAGLPAEEEKFESETAACSKGLISFSRTKSKGKKMDVDNDKSGSTVTDYNVIGNSFSDQDTNDLSSSTSSTSGFGESLSSESKSEVSISLGSNTEYSEENNSVVEPVPTFKSRKNVRKQFRKRNNDGETGDTDD